MDLPFFLYKLVKSAMVPPGVFTTIAAFFSFLAFRKPRKPFLGGALLVFAALLWLLSAPVGERVLLQPLEKACTPSLPEGGNPVVLVLGGGSRYGNQPGEAEPGPYTLQRVIGAFSLAKTRGWPMLVSGTRPSGPGHVSGARAMAKTLRELGFTGAILLEEESRTTWENFERSSKLIHIYGFDSVIVVTNAFHMKRSIWCAEKTLPDVKIHPWPVGRLSDERPLDALDFLPESLHESLLGIREHAGLAVYRIIHGG